MKPETIFLTAFQKETGIRPSLLAQITTLPEKIISEWLHNIDESAYTVEEWAESIAAFDQWAQGAGREFTITHMLEYLSCCAESARSGVKLPLTFLLQEFLKTNGVE
jgi:hypothetical protein